jgi:hypothetical protein
MCMKIVGFFMVSTLSDEKMGLQFTSTIASGPCQSRHFWVQSLRTHDHNLMSHLRLPRTGGPGPGIYMYIPQEREIQLYPRALGSFFFPPLEISNGNHGDIC